MLENREETTKTRAKIIQNEWKTTRGKWNKTREWRRRRRRKTVNNINLLSFVWCNSVICIYFWWQMHACKVCLQRFIDSWQDERRRSHATRTRSKSKHDIFCMNIILPNLCIKKAMIKLFRKIWSKDTIIKYTPPFTLTLFEMQ